MKYKFSFYLIFIYLIALIFNSNSSSVFSEKNLQPPGDNTIRIVTYNIRFGFGSYGRPTISSISKLISSLNADIICLQEVDKTTLRSLFINQPKKLQKELSMYLAYGETEKVPPGKTGKLILSKYPISKVENIPLSSAKYSRTALRVTLDTPKGKLDVINIHLGLSKEVRFDQLNEINKALFPDSTPTILAGDFNITDTSELEPLLSEFIDTAVETKQSHLNTFENKNKKARIDYVLVEKNLIPKYYSIPKVKYSDHYPIIVDIEKIN